MKRASSLAIATVTAFASWATPTQAQVGLVKIEFTPWAGAYVPVTDLVETEAGVTAPVSINTSVAVGGNIGVRLPLGIAVEGQVGYAPAEIEFEFPAQTTDLNVLFASANLQWRFGPPLIPVKPFFTGGIGVIRWESDVFSSFGAGESVTNLAGNVGAGAYVNLGPVLSLRFDGRAYLTSFNAQEFDPSALDVSKFQSHVVLSGGLVFNFGV